MMPNSPTPISGESNRKAVVRELIFVFVRSAALIILVVVILNQLPEEQNIQAFGVIAGMLVLATIYVVFFIRQLRAVQKSKFPNIRAAEAMFTTGILLLAIFSSIYVGISLSNPGAFTEVLTPFSSMYFSTTVLATVGFGDIAPNTVPARSAAMTQMVLNLVYIGVVVKVFAGAAKRTRANKNSAQPIAD
jgi:hypothetical protein